MKYLIDAHNTISAGTINVTKNFIEGLLKCGDENLYYIVLPKLPEFDRFRGLNKTNIHLLYIPQFRGLFQLTSRIFYQIIIFPVFALFIRPKSILILGNYSLMPWREKVVLMQQLYLIDDTLYKGSDLKVRIIEGVVRLLFRLTLMSTSKIIVQRNRSKKQFSAKYKGNVSVTVLPSPVSDIISHAEHGRQRPSEKIILYVSRYYKHKNHEFIIKIAERYSKELREENIRFYITLDPALGKEVEDLISTITEGKLDDIVNNIFEVPQEELIKYYNRAIVLFFPSKAESFGLPIVEAMASGLPVVVPDLEYAYDICGEAGIYYKEDDVDDAYRHLIEICEDEALWKQYSEKSLEQYKKFPTVEKWIEEILKRM